MSDNNYDNLNVLKSDNNLFKYAIITGITGQDGSYLAELLLSKDYKVCGIIRRSSNFNTSRVDHLFRHSNLKLHYGDLIDMTSILNVLNSIYDKALVIEFYNLAAQSHVHVSFVNPQYTTQVDANGTLNCLEAIKQIDKQNKIKFYQASTSELYGKVQEVPQTELTPFNPRSPYACAKLYSYWIVRNYREAYKMFACNGILFNHTSERRGKTFVERKITIGLNNVLMGKQKVLELGNIDSKRDWGYAPDYVYGMWLMLQHNTPDDFVLATNRMISVRQFIEKCCNILNIVLKWRGEGINEEGYDSTTNKTLIKINPKYFRPTEVEQLLGNPKKAYDKLGWKPKHNIDKIIDIMVSHDCKEYLQLINHKS